MKIFITGLAGFLGSHLADRMIELGHEVIGNDTLIGGYRDNVPKKAKLYIIDCCDNDKMSMIMEGCDIVIHTAATAHEGLSVFSPSFITRNIFEASVSTISAAIQNKVKRFVYCTSMARYGDQQAPFHEKMTPRPVDPYGIAKVAGEEVLKALCETHGMEWNIAVPHNIVGPRQRYDDPFRNVMSIMINRNLQGKPAIIYGDGKQTRCFSYVEDCINCLEKMALDPNIKSEIINIGPDEGTITVAELAALVAKECADGKSFTWPPIHMPDRPREVKHASCTADKARKLLNYETKTDLRKAIAETVEYVKKKGPKPFDYTYPLEIISDKTPKTWKDRLM
jgi:UDP-glucose 4-epimerase